jgi:Acyl-CoA dehydrogenase, C-terminal domain
MTSVLLPSEIGIVAAEAVRELGERAIGGVPVADYAEKTPLAWSTVAEGGWDMIGAPESADGGGASLRDLVEVARTCGALALPSPIVETIWVKRWSAAGRELDNALSVSIPRQGASDGSGLVPFGAADGVLAARRLGTDQDVFESAQAGEPDTLSPVLRPTVVPWVTALEPEPARELLVLWAAESTGAAQRLVDLSVEYAKERKQFGKPIGSFQAIKHRLADMHSQAEYADTAVVWASTEPENSLRAARYALDAAITVAQGAIQVHGGMGFTWEMGLHYFLRSMLVRRELAHGLWP